MFFKITHVSTRQSSSGTLKILLFIDHNTAGVDYGQFPDTGIGLANIMLPDESVVWSGILIREDSIVEYNETFTVG